MGLGQVAVCCNVLQCVAVCVSDDQQGMSGTGFGQVAVSCSVLQCVAVYFELCCNVWQCVAVCRGVLQCVAVYERGRLYVEA